MKKIINLIKELWEMVKYYSTAPFECAFCPYYARCKQEIEEPEDNPDGSCKQKDIYAKINPDCLEMLAEAEKENE